MSEEARRSAWDRGPLRIVGGAIYYAIVMRVSSFYIPGRPDPALAWDGFDFSIGLLGGSAYLAGGACLSLLLPRRVGGGPYGIFLLVLAVVYLNHGLDRLLADRPGVAPGFAAVQAVASLAAWTCLLARPAAGTTPEKGTIAVSGVLLTTLFLTTLYWCIRAARVEGCDKAAWALAAPVAARVFAGWGLTLRSALVNNRREIEAYRARRRAAGAARAIAAAAPPGA